MSTLVLTLAVALTVAIGCETQDRHGDSMDLTVNPQPAASRNATQPDSGSMAHMERMGLHMSGGNDMSSGQGHEKGCAMPDSAEQMDQRAGYGTHGRH